MFARRYKASLFGLAAGAIMMGAQAVSADTITVHSSPNNPSSITFQTGGAFAGDYQYQYNIDFDSQADVIGGDGFLIADFGPLVGYTLTAVNPGNSAEVALAGNFSESSPVDATGLSGFLGNTSDSDNFSFSINGATIVDSRSIANAVFTYDSSTPFTTPTTVDLTLDLYSTTGLSTLGNGLGVDHSGGNATLSGSLNQVLVPIIPLGTASVPLPLASVGGGAL